MVPSKQYLGSVQALEVKENGFIYGSNDFRKPVTTYATGYWANNLSQLICCTIENISKKAASI